MNRTVPPKISSRSNIFSHSFQTWTRRNTKKDLSYGKNMFTTGSKQVSPLRHTILLVHQLRKYSLLIRNWLYKYKYNYKTTKKIYQRSFNRTQKQCRTFASSADVLERMKWKKKLRKFYTDTHTNIERLNRRKSLQKIILAFKHSKPNSIIFLCWPFTNDRKWSDDRKVLAFSLTRWKKYTVARKHLQYRTRGFECIACAKNRWIAIPIMNTTDIWYEFKRKNQLCLELARETVIFITSILYILCFFFCNSTYSKYFEMKKIIMKSTVEIHEYVLAHMRSYCPWPARILRILSNSRCEIKFYGDNGRT